MSKAPHWQLIATERLRDCRIFELQRLHARSPRSAALHDFTRIHSPDWVNVIPLTKQGQVVMVRQYRHGLQGLTLEIPGGIVDPGEEPAQACARELREETGYRATRLEKLGALNPNPALFDNHIHTFLAEDCEHAGAVQNSATEETLVELVAMEELPERVRAGDITHALVIAALHWWELAHARGAIAPRPSLSHPAHPVDRPERLPEAIAPRPSR